MMILEREVWAVLSNVSPPSAKKHIRTSSMSYKPWVRVPVRAFQRHHRCTTIPDATREHYCLLHTEWNYPMKCCKLAAWASFQKKKHPHNESQHLWLIGPLLRGLTSCVKVCICRHKERDNFSVHESGQFRPIGQCLIWSSLTVRVTCHKSYNLRATKLNRI